MDIITAIRSAFHYSTEEFLRDIHYRVDLGQALQNPRYSFNGNPNTNPSIPYSKQTYQSGGKNTSISQNKNLNKNSGLEGRINQKKIINQQKHPSLFK